MTVIKDYSKLWRLPDPLLRPWPVWEVAGLAGVLALIAVAVVVGWRWRVGNPGWNVFIG